MYSSFHKEGRSSAAKTEAQSIVDPSPYLVPWGPGSGVILPPFTVANSADVESSVSPQLEHFNASHVRLALNELAAQQRPEDYGPGHENGEASNV